MKPQLGWWEESEKKEHEAPMDTCWVDNERGGALSSEFKLSHIFISLRHMSFSSITFQNE